MISEPAFLLTELRYTLGQLHVQLGDLDESMRTKGDGGACIDEILDSMVSDEDRYQAHYSRMLNVSVPQEGGDEQFRGHAAFENKRAQTVALLEQVGDNWPAELVDCVREQVAADRKYTTQIADRRKELYEQDQRPDLEEPLTTDPHPHVQTESEGQASTESSQSP